MAESVKGNIYHSIKPNFGYSLNLSVANLIVKKHEEKTGTKYKVLRSDPNFGEATWNNEDCQIKWEESEKTPGERLPFDGIPFFVLGTRHLGCHFSEEEKMNIYLDWKRDNDGSECEAKKEKCPAVIILKEVIKFPNYKIEANSPYEKKKWSKIVRDDLCKGEAEIQRRIYVELPKLDDHVHTITWKQKSDPEVSDLSHCLVCNAKISSSTRATVAVFAEGARTSHRQLEVSAVLGDVVQEKLLPGKLHSTILCSKCFNLLDEIDSLEEQLANKKQYMVDKYSRTNREVTGRLGCQDELMEGDDDDDDGPHGKRLPKERKRGRPPGSTRGRPRGRPRTKSVQKSPEKSIVKVEVDTDKIDEYSVSYISAVPSPPPPSLKTIKKEDIMSDLDSSVDHPSSIMEEDEGEEIVAVAELGESLVEQVSVELQGEVLEVVGEVLEKEKKLEQKMYSCSECDKQFLTRAACRNHVKVHSHQISYDCPDCEKSFSSKYRLKSHAKTHENRDRPFECKECNKSFYTAYQLNAHVKSHAGYRQFVCDLCGKALSTQKTLELHALTHSGEKPYQCEFCGSTFRQRSNLHTHIKSKHFQEKKHQCQICQKSFVRKRLLEYHMNSMHTGERPYKCELCSSTFVYPHYYKRHLRKHTGDKPHKCHICAKQFTSRENRNAHLFTHTTKRPYECKICGAGFMRKPLCVSHVSSHVPLGSPEEFIVFNSPSQMVNAATAQGEIDDALIISNQSETDRAVQAVRMVEGVDGTVAHEVTDDTPHIYAMNDKVVKVMPRPGYIIEAEDNTRYVIHAPDRGRDENMEHFFATIQGQVVEVRTDDF